MRSLKRWLGPGCLLLLAAGLAGHPAGTRLAPPAGSPAALLDRQGSLFGHDLARDQRLQFRIWLTAGEGWRLELDQAGVDLAAGIGMEAGEPALRVDSANRRWGPEKVVFVAADTGWHSLVVQGLLGHGHFTLRAETVRPATREDRIRAGAALAVARGQARREQGGEELWAAAQADFEAAREDYRSLGDAGQELLVQAEIAQNWAARGQPISELAAYRAALSMPAAGRDLRFQVYLKNACSRILLKLGRQAEAVSEADAALAQARAAGYRHDEAMAFNLLALGYRQADDPQRAIEANQQAQEIWAAMGEPSEEAATWHNLGVSLLSVGREISAEAAFGKALAIRRSIGETEGAANSSALLAQVLTQRGRLGEAQLLLEEALLIQQSLQNEVGQAQVLERLAFVEQKSGQFAGGDATFSAALAIYERRGERLRVAYTLAERGWLRLSGGLAGERPDLEAAHALFRELREPVGEAFSLLGLAEATRAGGRLETALALAREALDKVESLRDKLSSSMLRQTFLHGRRRYFEVPIQILMELHARQPGAGFDRAAFEISELARSRALLDLLAEARSAPALPEAPGHRELEELAGQISAKRFERLRLPAGTDDSGLQNEIRELLLRYENLEAHLIASRQAGDPLPKARALGAAEAQAQLGDGSLLLEFFVGEERSYLWVVGNDLFRSFELPARREIESLARQLAALWGSGDQALAAIQGPLVARAVSQMLLGQAAGLLADRRLVVAADGIVNYLPFGALPQPDSGPAARPLIADHEVVAIHSISVLAQQRRSLAHRGPAPSRLVVVADPRYRRTPRDSSAGEIPPAWPSPEVHRAAAAVGIGELPDLPFSRLEAESLLALVPPGLRRELLGFDASRQNVLSGALGRFQIVHFATHGLLDTQLPQLSSLVLSQVDRQGELQDGFVAAYEIERLSLAADLVVLSACRSGLGEEVQGEGLVGLSQSFLVAGARQVAVSLWAIDDRSTSELMVAFYRAMLQDGRSPAAALREAQMAMQEKYPASPYRWGAFVIFGDWRTTKQWVQGIKRSGFHKPLLNQELASTTIYRPAKTP